MADTIQAFGLRWTVPYAKDWIYEDGVLSLIVPRPALAPRRPTQFALAQTPGFTRVRVEAEARKEPFAERGRRTSLLIVYAWRDSSHFNYAHLSVDPARRADHHNGVFHVFGGERVRISSLEGPGSLVEDRWQK